MKTAEWIWIVGLVLLGLAAGLVASQYSLLAVLVIAGIVGGAAALAWSMTLTHRQLIITLLGASILLPGIPVPGLFQVRPEELIVLALMPAILVRLRARLNRIDLAFGLLLLSTVASMLWATLVKDLPFSPRDLMELVKLAKFWILFRLALYRWTEDDLRSIMSWLLLFLTISAAIGLLQWQNPMGLGLLTQEVYGQGSAHVGLGRITGSLGGSPVYFSVLMAVGLVLAITMLSWYRRRWLLIGICGLFLSAIGLTLSRSGVLIAGLVILVIGFARAMDLQRFLTRTRLTKIMIVLVVLLVLGAVLGFWLAGEMQSLLAMNAFERLRYAQTSPVHKILFRFSYAEEGRDARLIRWQENLNQFLESPWLGLGPGKTTKGTVADNGYVLQVRRYGFIGLAILLFLFWQILRANIKALRFYPYHSANWSIAATSASILVGLLAANVFSEVFGQLQITSLYWLVVGLAYSVTYFQTDPAREPDSESILGGSPCTS